MAADEFLPEGWPGAGGAELSGTSLGEKEEAVGVGGGEAHGGGAACLSQGLGATLEREREREREPGHAPNRARSRRGRQDTEKRAGKGAKEMGEGARKGRPAKGQIPEGEGGRHGGRRAGESISPPGGRAGVRYDTFEELGKPKAYLWTLLPAVAPRICERTQLELRNSPRPPAAIHSWGVRIVITVISLHVRGQTQQTMRHHAMTLQANG